MREEGFAMYVPTNYEPSAPMGILFYEVNHGTPRITGDLQALMDKHHLIMIATQRNHLPLGASAGLGLDAVFNLENQYAIDRKRIYLIGGGEGIEQVGLCTGDIFTGDTYIWSVVLFHKFENYLPNTDLIPSEQMLRVAKTRPQVLVFKEDPSEAVARKAIVKAMVVDGFQHVLVNQVDGLSIEWFDQVLKMMESVHAGGPTTRDVAATQPSTMPARTGQFEITFDQRSPLSEYSRILERLGTTKDEAGPDYELKDQPFIVFVPSDYDGSKPFGLMVWSFQDGSSGIYDSALPLLNAHHLIVIATEKAHPPLATNTGLCLDAVYNMEQRYAIDPARVYLIGLSKPIMPIGMCTGDVFMGDVYCWWFEFYGPINGETPVSPVKYKPAPGLVRLAKLHMQVLEFNPTQALDLKNIPATLRQDGFDHVFAATMDKNNYFQPEWFEQVISRLESVHTSSTKSPEAISTTQPSPDEPQRLLGLAQSFINSGRPDLAKRKLELLISKYPDSPAAEQARQLLSQMNGQ